MKINHIDLVAMDEAVSCDCGCLALDLLCKLILYTKERTANGGWELALTGKRSISMLLETSRQQTMLTNL